MAAKADSKCIGDYTITGKPLGSGGMATVYLVEKNKKKFAAKVLHRHLMRERKTVERFKQEFDIGVKMKANKAFVEMIELIKHDGAWTIIMEYLPGMTLHNVINKMAPLSNKEATAITYELAAALENFHLNNFVHRDLKPDNILITTAGHVKIMDYGVTRDLGTNLTKTGTAVGTPLYMAPEQICGSKSTDCRCDIYSLSLIMYRMLTRKDAHRMKRNFEFIELVETRMKKPVKEIPDLEQDTMAFIEKCLYPNPEERFPTTKEFCSVLAQTSGFTKKRITLIKKILKTIETNANKKVKGINIDKTIVDNPQDKKLKKLVILSGLAAGVSIGLTFYFFGAEKSLSVLKRFFAQFF
ncbi:MAG: serine/threonine protein kinase [Lentisphaeraceae bacterium]|nr:serine/threonine protein kinase [Lentisphaeraceae bacterium]